ncbi:NAD-dependent DNA ligase LigA [Blattabacterium cuenoti]|uniref:NAD-dependent DNA ligase LigA n=1 Tax=Blattabacterium cuenoti TaxID=1653831 RepID=UPI00163C243C|nr:NAD-dependent DNA ligase LigA [Blattabacterium cuenoti]
MNNKKTIIKKIYKLRKQLLEFNHKYYNLGYSEVSDSFFDKKLEELIFLEKKYPELYDSNSPTLQIGHSPNEDFKSYRYKMYSIQNVYSKYDLIRWNKKIKKLLNNYSFICELKYDGISINLIYEKGIFKHAITRGNGTKGKNVTKNVKNNIKSIPLKLKGDNIPPYLEIRGEIFIKKDNFIKINTIRIKNKKNIYLNLRNSVSGIILGNKENMYNINLSFIAFHLIGKKFSTQYESLYQMNIWGFKTKYYNTRIYNDLNGVFQFIKYWEKIKNKLSYQIDGIVIKINEYEKQLVIGTTKKYPKWAVAFKFKQNTLETKLINVNYQIGRTGVITPVAQIKPIFISGTTIKKVTLYNNEFIKKNDLHYGDSIIIEKGGDIIPKLIKINKKKRLNINTPIFFSKICPSCHNILTKQNNLYYCNNNDCSSKRIMKLIHFSSENGMNIKKLGANTIKKLYKLGILYYLHDFFLLKINDLIKINRIKKKLSSDIINNINNSKKKSYHRVLYALGIRHVGEDISKKLSDNFYNINNLMNATYKKLISISGIGKKITKSIINYFSDQENKYVIKMLIQCGLNFSNKKNYMNSFIRNKSFVFTGKLFDMTRIEAKNIIENSGGKVYNTINNKVDFLVVGKNYGSKLKKSINKNFIKILTEDYFKSILKKEGLI